MISIQLCIPGDLEGRIRNGGYYDPVRIQDRGYPKKARNAKEDFSEAWTEQEEATMREPLLESGTELRAMGETQSTALPDNDSQNLDGQYDDRPVRHLGPRWLCFLKDGPRGPKTAYQVCRVNDWREIHGDNAHISFILVSYTREQFSMYNEAIMAEWKPPPSAEIIHERSRLVSEDKSTLTMYGIKAARDAGVAAFWVDFECMPGNKDEATGISSSYDVYRISDVVRAAHSLIIVTGPSLETRYSWGEKQPFSADHMTVWLQQWGSRLWTLPEILLCSSEHRIRIFATGDPDMPRVLAKRMLPERSVWRDKHLVRELMDHYEGTIHLTPLELVNIALNCFAERGTSIFSPGDMSYALMGLLRRRPKVDKKDTSFEAFARLSLANDSDALLERLICLQQTKPGKEWFDLGDAWGAKLWDIEPRCQIAAIAEGETVVLDGAYGASIQWDECESCCSLSLSRSLSSDTSLWTGLSASD